MVFILFSVKSTAEEVRCIRRRIFPVLGCGLKLPDPIQADRRDMPVIFAGGYSNEMLRDGQIAPAPLREQKGRHP